MDTAADVVRIGLVSVVGDLRERRRDRVRDPAGGADVQGGAGVGARPEVPVAVVVAVDVGAPGVAQAAVSRGTRGPLAVVTTMSTGTTSDTTTITPNTAASTRPRSQWPRATAQRVRPTLRR